ncbi:MAG: hypothetical protein DLM61_25395 [Pseudonocardiales bacterium]|nr:MAG: hypothetical protein DLM61_25395 [Pseudonocardiales bacterium]
MGNSTDAPETQQRQISPSTLRKHPSRNAQHTFSKIISVKRNFTAIGDTTNLTARLAAAAGVGEVLISETTLAQLGGCTVVHNLGPLELKGKQSRSPLTALSNRMAVVRGR